MGHKGIRRKRGIVFSNLQGWPKRWSPGSVNMRLKSCVLLLAAGWRMQFFLLIFTDPGVHLLGSFRPSMYIIQLAKHATQSFPPLRSWHTKLCYSIILPLLPRINLEHTFLVLSASVLARPCEGPLHSISRGVT